MLPHKLIEQRLQEAVNAVLPDADASTVLVRPCPDPKFGDYQTNALMSLAKARKMNPRQLAADVRGQTGGRLMCAKTWRSPAPASSISGSRPAPWPRPLQVRRPRRTPVLQPHRQPRTVVVDFSSPNVAKPMHVGHIRSTILGDSLARIAAPPGPPGHHRQPPGRLGHAVWHVAGRLEDLARSGQPRRPIRSPRWNASTRPSAPSATPKNPGFNQATLDRARRRIGETAGGRCREPRRSGAR